MNVILIVSVVPRYLNLATFSNDSLAIMCQINNVKTILISILYLVPIFCAMSKFLSSCFASYSSGHKVRSINDLFTSHIKFIKLSHAMKTSCT
jgi:hypothetical protein